MLRIGGGFNFLLTLFLTAQEFKGSLKEDTVDYSIYTANIKRKRPTPRKGRKSGYMGGEDDEDPTPRKGRKSVYMGGEDDEGDDDEDWTGGVRGQSNSGRKGNNSRGSRQR